MKPTPLTYEQIDALWPEITMPQKVTRRAIWRESEAARDKQWLDMLAGEPVAWQPIETAPKDGTRVLLCKATDADGATMGESFGLFVHRAAWWGGEGWIVYCSLVREPKCFFEPTHWMPIPAAPSTHPPAQQAADRDAQEAPFEEWWERHGQFGRAGGGQYEKTFAWNAWCAAKASTPVQPVQDKDAEIAKLREDAERLEWLCASHWYVGPGNFYCDEAGGLQELENKNHTPDALRAAIDEARGKQ